MHSSEPSRSSSPTLQAHHRRADYKSRFTRSSAKTEEVARWQQRLLHKRADHLNRLKASQVDAQRAGLACYQDEGEFTQEEEALMRRLVKTEQRRFYSDQHDKWFRDVGETDISEAEREEAGPCRLILPGNAHLRAARTDIQALLASEPPPADTATFAQLLLEAPCPVCQQSTLHPFSRDALGCAQCSWRLAEGALACSAPFAQHSFALSGDCITDANEMDRTDPSHRPLFFYDSSIGSMLVCSVCDEVLALP
jgi:hypothetical protein